MAPREELAERSHGCLTKKEKKKRHKLQMVKSDCPSRMPASTRDDRSLFFLPWLSPVSNCEIGQSPFFYLRLVHNKLTCYS